MDSSLTPKVNILKNLTTIFFILNLKSALSTVIVPNRRPRQSFLHILL
jgi:hypothetical protein